VSALGKSVRLGVLALAALALFATPAFGQSGYQLQTHVSSHQVEVGSAFTLTLTAMVDKGGGMPHNPELRVPSGLSAHGPSVGTQQQISLSGGQFSQRVGINATWTIEASKTGHYRIGPPSIEIGGQRLSGDVVEVQVVPPGAAPRQSNPFDPFGMGLPQLPSFPSMPFGDDDDDNGTSTLPPFPVVGEQITLDIYAYGRRGPFRETNTSEPSREAFLAQNILDNSYSEPTYRVPIGGDVWLAKKVREIALFPIRAGLLLIGPMRMGFEGRGYPTSGTHLGLVRQSAPIQIVVTEPPEKGRPPGYKLGDVGRYSLSANVEPREISQGDSVSVVAKLEGTGNLPFTLKTPEQSGVGWLDPTTVDQVEPHGKVIGGWRKFTYVVRIDRPGDVDLGELRLPYWDPERESYDVASAKLGVIKVKPSSAAAAKDSSQDDTLKDAVPLRKTLGQISPASEHLTDRGWFWLLVVLAPLGVFVSGESVTLARRLGRRMAEKRESLGRSAARALDDARRAAADGDLAKTATAAERAVVAAIEEATGLKARGVLRAELASELAKRGIDASVAAKVTELFDLGDDVRFTGRAGEIKAAELSERAADLVREIGRGKKNGGSREG
jgi:hypothetical protein